MVRVLAAASVVGLVVGVAGTAAAGGSRARASQGVRTYSTRATLPLRTSLFDPYSFVGNSDAFPMARDAGATYVRLMFNWSSVAPATRPANFVASDESSDGYTWDHLDAQVAAAEDSGVTPILDVFSTPKWAYAVRPHGSRAGTPNSRDLGQFATALATHYDGAHGAPAVHYFEVWNEPNLSLSLSPVKPAAYRAMVNAVATSVHAVNRNDIVVAGGLDPFENVAPRFVALAPLSYMSSLLCVSMGNPKAKKAALRKPHATCKTKVRFDAWSHHPYTFGGPFGHARRKDDVSLGDLPKMRALLRAAVKLHRVVSSHPVQFWVTEFSWDTNPPRRHAAPLGLQARWTAESLYQMWRSGVSLATWFLLQDRPNPSPYQSGLYFHSKNLEEARAKPTLTAFRFPFVAYLGKRSVSVWGRDETSTKTLVSIQLAHRRRGPWRTVARIVSNRSGIFKASLALKAKNKDWLRATAPGASKSLPFSLTVPKTLRIGPWGN
ncbi:MAG TPA: cellulase family glycosylhydrolase [Gaiellaceae bacterium]|nr:cellulase family glycosylhydrolase [Gaiellaceae bacterium]